MDDNENTLIIEVTGDQSDVEFLRERCHAAVVEVVEEYENYLDSEVDVDWRWKR